MGRPSRWRPRGGQIHRGVVQCKLKRNLARSGSIDCHIPARSVSAAGIGLSYEGARRVKSGVHLGQFFFFGPPVPRRRRPKTPPFMVPPLSMVADVGSTIAAPPYPKSFVGFLRPYTLSTALFQRRG